MTKSKEGPRIWRPSDDPGLRQSTVLEILESVDTGNHDPEQVRRVIGRIVQVLDEPVRFGRDAVLPHELSHYLRDALKTYLESPRRGALEAALGLTPPAHRRAKQESDNEQNTIAHDVLRARLKGIAAKATYGLVGGKHDASASRVEKIWSERKRQSTALYFECASRSQIRRHPLFNAAEAKILRSIYPDAIL